MGPAVRDAAPLNRQRGKEPQEGMSVSRRIDWQRVIVWSPAGHRTCRQATVKLGIDALTGGHPGCIHPRWQQSLERNEGSTDADASPRHRTRVQKSAAKRRGRKRGTPERRCESSGRQRRFPERMQGHQTHRFARTAKVRTNAGPLVQQRKLLGRLAGTAKRNPSRGVVVRAGSKICPEIATSEKPEGPGNFV